MGPSQVLLGQGQNRPKRAECDKSRHGPTAACPKLPCLYQLTVCLLFFPGLSSAQQKCSRTSSVVNCRTSLHAHGVGCLLLLLLLLFSHCPSALRPPASLHQPAPCQLRCSQPSALPPLTSGLLLPPSSPSFCKPFWRSGGPFLPRGGLQVQEAPGTCPARRQGWHSDTMAGGEKNAKALREVWKRAENSLCADCGKPGESPRVAGGQGRGRTWSLGLILAWWGFGAAC